MRRLAIAFLLLVLAAAVGLLLRETFLLAERAGQQEVAAREAGELAASLRSQLEEARRDAGQVAAKGAADVARLEGEVARLTQQVTVMADAARAVAEREAQRVAAVKAESSRMLQPMPEGVRTCLASLHECLAIEGFTDLRFLRARGLDGEGLHDVEVVHTSPDRLDAEILFAHTMTAELDRAKGRLELVFFEGTRTVGGAQQALPKDGWKVVCEPVDPRSFEARLPSLVRATGIAPEAAPRPGPRPTDVDPAARLEWLDRFALLLRGAGTRERIQIQRFRGISEHEFLDVSLLGTDAKGEVLFGASCARLAVEVDRKAGVVSLWLRDGCLRRGEAESTISGEGYRMLLPDVTAETAVERMLGMVVTK
ncbi:MAG: hypothetical protein U1E73_13605 [Planctomycetota bacterium]